MTPKKRTCPYCNHINHGLLDDAVVMGCPACFRTSQIVNGLPQRIPGPQLPKQVYYVNPDWLRPGVKLTYLDKVYTVASIMVYNTHWTEWDNEDRRWISGESDSEEWYAFAEDGSELCLEYDDGKHFIRREIEKPSPQTLSLVKNATDRALIEYGQFRLHGFIGEDDEEQDQREYEYKVLSEHAGDLYAEWLRQDLNGTIRLYEYLYVSPLSLKKMRLYDAESQEKALESLPDKSFLRYLFGGMSALFALLLLWALIGAGDKPVFENVYSFNARPDYTDSLKNLVRSLGTFHLQADKAYQFRTTCTLVGENVQAGFDLSLVRVSDGAIINDFDCAYFRESGRDSEGDWTESVLKDGFRFRTEETGEYELFVMQRQDPTSGTMRQGGGSLNIQITPWHLQRYYFLGLLLSVVLWLVFQHRYESGLLIARPDRPTPFLRMLDMK